MKKLMVLILSVIMCFSIMATSASAAGIITAEREGATFDKAWEISVEFASGGADLGVMVYGFNTAWIDEDYTWTKAFVGTSIAGVRRVDTDSSTNWGDNESSGTYSKIEVRHKEDTVYYYAFFSDAGTDTTITAEYPSTVK